MNRRSDDEQALRDEVGVVASLERTQVVILGGGINGIAILRDLALQGVDAVLVDRADFASGATAASSHMIHGGIRYLENGEFRLVRESVRERNDLLRTAPHHVRPLRTTIPIYSTFSGILSAPLRFVTHRAGRPRARGALLIKVGLVLYDLFSKGGREVPRHRFAGRKRTLRDLPAIDRNVKYSATYFDAGVRDPERLAIDVLLDGLAAHSGAHAINYVESIGLSANGVRLRDLESGHEFLLAADVVVNATGPWADLTNAALGVPSELTGGTKGSHIVLDHPDLLAATAGREIFFEHADGRIVLIYPIRDRVLVGTTDIEADPAEPAVCTDEEVDYFLTLINHVFPNLDVPRSSIVYRFSGIRPLPRHGDVQPGFVSRDYRITTVEHAGTAPVLTVVGGKWTTFRALGESVADRVLQILAVPRRSRTLGLVIGGGRGYPLDHTGWMTRELVDVEVDRRETLFERYGTRAAEVAQFIAAGPDAPIIGANLSTREVEYLARRERVAHLSDLVFRRTDLAFSGRADEQTLVALGTALAAAMGWDREDLAREIDTCRRMLLTETFALPDR